MPHDAAGTDTDSSRVLHHVGFVVADIASAGQGLSRGMALQWDAKIWDDPLQRAKVTFLVNRSGEAQIELVEPVGEQAFVRGFLMEKGGGLHHLCYEVADVGREMADMKLRGAMIVSRPKPAAAFGGRRIAWMMTPEKLLIELLEREAHG